MECLSEPFFFVNLERKFQCSRCKVSCTNSSRVHCFELQLQNVTGASPTPVAGDKLRFSDLSFRFDGIYGVLNAPHVAKFLLHNNCMTKQ